MVILGIDPSLRSTGFAVIQGDNRRFSAMAYGVIKNKPTLLVSGCLAHIHEKLQQVMTEFKPDVCAIEGLIYAQNIKTSITMGQARGVAIAAAALKGIPVYEYAPRLVKNSVVGYGGAGKGQVARMLGPLLGLTDEIPLDASDAFAIALTHANANPAIQLSKPI
ncbi:MAG: crossover junction endodeoxyribonuclease RuvC [Verrucomicrobiota bacterium]|nr:crossover junction endodeoxyribonuclease RuvC [Verrucomicrobiota bacterium]